MAILFSRVILTAGNRSASLLMSGVPERRADFWGWRAYEGFMTGIHRDEQIQVTVKAYLYGEQEPVIATIEEVAYMQMRLDRRPDFLESRCRLVREAEFVG